MLDKALKGSPKYYAWVFALLAIIGLGMGFYLMQLSKGLTVTGLSRDVSWGFYIAQFTYLVGVAASAVMLVLPYYFHDYKAFGKLIIMGEFLAVSAVVMCLGFIVVDIGSPQRMLNIIWYPTPNSILFWDMIVLNGYLFLNVVVGWNSLQCYRKGMSYPKWVKNLAYVSVFWAFSIHTVTAFLYAGLPGRHYWLTAIMAARFLASAFCSGPSLLLLLFLLLRRLKLFEPGQEAVKTLATIITYAMGVNVFFFLLEVFTAYYSGMPGHIAPLQFLFSGYEGHTYMVGFMWTATVLGLGSLALLLNPKWRYNMNILPVALIMLFIGTWIDKGMALIVAGFTPNPFEKVTEYMPSFPELMISLMVYALGALTLTILWKIVLEVKKEVEE